MNDRHFAPKSIKSLNACLVWKINYWLIHSDFRMNSRIMPGEFWETIPVCTISRIRLEQLSHSRKDLGWCLNHCHWHWKMLELVPTSMHSAENEVALIALLTIVLRWEIGTLILHYLEQHYVALLMSFSKWDCHDGTPVWLQSRQPRCHGEIAYGARPNLHSNAGDDKSKLQL